MDLTAGYFNNYITALKNSIIWLLQGKTKLYQLK